MEFMGLFNSKVLLKNPHLPELETVEVDALADSGAVHPCVPQQVSIQLKLDSARQMTPRERRSYEQ